MRLEYKPAHSYVRGDGLTVRVASSIALWFGCKPLITVATNGIVIGRTVIWLMVGAESPHQKVVCVTCGRREWGIWWDTVRVLRERRMPFNLRFLWALRPRFYTVNEAVRVQLPTA